MVPDTCTVGAVTVNWPGPPPGRLVVAGDWHGNDRAARNALEAASALGSTLVLQLGDFGVWPGSAGQFYLDKVDNAAAHCGSTVAFIDGNHEDFEQLYSVPLDTETGLRQVRSNVWHIPRGSAWTWSGVRFRALGGATSVDRLSRILGKSWWPEEAITPADAARTIESGPCDVLLTHDCPSGVDVPGIAHRDYLTAGRSGWPLSELERAWDHRDALADVTRRLDPKHLWHGHFHERYSALASLGGSVETAVEGLADDGAGPHQNLMVVDVDNSEVVTRSLGSALVG